MIEYEVQYKLRNGSKLSKAVGSYRETDGSQAVMDLETFRQLLPEDEFRLIKRTEEEVLVNGEIERELVRAWARRCGDRSNLSVEIDGEFERGFKAAWDVWMGKEAENVEGIIQRLEDI